MSCKFCGTGKQQCSKCQHKSISGLIRGRGFCPYHWAEHISGIEWANKCFPGFVSECCNKKEGDK